MTPHTLEEQISLLAAEADGRAVYRLSSDEAGRKYEKAAGYWDFARDRYEVERPLMEGWANQYSGHFGSLYATEAEAREAAASHAVRIAVHMKEVR